MESILVIFASGGIQVLAQLSVHLTWRVCLQQHEIILRAFKRKPTEAEYFVTKLTSVPTPCSPRYHIPDSVWLLACPTTLQPAPRYHTSNFAWPPLPDPFLVPIICCPPHGTAPGSAWPLVSLTMLLYHLLIVLYFLVHSYIDFLLLLPLAIPIHKYSGFISARYYPVNPTPD